MDKKEYRLLTQVANLIRAAVVLVQSGTPTSLTSALVADVLELVEIEALQLALFLSISRLS